MYINKQRLLFNHQSSKNPMTRIKIYSLLAFISLSGVASAQKAATTDMMKYSLTPKDKLEIGLNLGVLTYQGDLPGSITPSVGAHIRKAFDHIFSLSGDLQLGSMKGKVKSGDAPRSTPTTSGEKFFTEFKTPWASGTLNMHISLNTNRYAGEFRKFNPYVLIGAGVAYNKSSVLEGGTYYEVKPAGNASAFSPVFNGGVGIGYRVNPKINIGADVRGFFLFGNRSDLVDGFDNNKNNDVVILPTLRLNYNLGKADEAEPLYWVNPMGTVVNDLAELKARPKFDPTDTDADGVIDMFDQEKNTPANTAVDTRGIALDSDSDGIVNSKDKEPYSPIGYKINAEGVAQVPKPAYITEGEANTIVDAKLALLKNAMATPSKGIADWFLPMIHFDFDRYSIKSGEYEKLEQVATVMQKNPSLRVAVTGHTDAVDSDAYNQRLSYNRAEAAINYLVTKYNVGRERFVLRYDGEGDKLVSSSSKNYINRRVEFEVASSESEMPAPANTAKKAKFKGGKQSGY
jgi:OmpA-OmpF porin, OOP family